VHGTIRLTISHLWSTFWNLFQLNAYLTTRIWPYSQVGHVFKHTVAAANCPFFPPSSVLSPSLQKKCIGEICCNFRHTNEVHINYSLLWYGRPFSFLRNTWINMHEKINRSLLVLLHISMKCKMPNTWTVLGMIYVFWCHSSEGVQSLAL
jgi:hypothetical protein